MSDKSLQVTQQQYETLASFRYALRRFLRFSEEAAHAIGLTPQQHQALLAIKGYPEGHPVSVGDLAERLQIQHHSAVGLVDRLVAEDLVGRQPGRSDKRQVEISLTTRGEELLGSLASAHQEQLHQVGPELIELLQRLMKPRG
ncbi:MAG TPA: MarR family transcriptional regulator [Candidatus Limnocylindria bacterium]|jgi:DNA-binding MarR family transcriptional regulator|nr:MarR family transcriptional regulator [Candidatus Limnocylindria bacterium]